MALPKPLKYIRVVLHTFVGLILFLLLVIPTILFSIYLRITGPKNVPLHSHFIIRVLYLAAAMFPYQWYHPALAIRTVLVPGDRSMVVKRDTWRAYWVGTLETKKIPAETRGGDPTWKVSLKGVDIIMLYAHGGGFVFGDAEMYNNIFCSWVQHFKTVHNKTLRILSVDYDLAPQKKFPYQRDQFLSAYRFLVNEIKWNPRKIIFGGDSAGGNILLNACYVLRENRLPPPRALLCISPWLRLDADVMTSPSMAHNRKTDYMPPQVFHKIAGCYAGSRDLADPHISPFYVNDHSKFPEMAILYSGAEVLRDDCARFVDHYQATGGRVSYHFMAEGMPHDYALLRELGGKTAVKDAERRLMEWVNILVEENRILFENRKRANAAAAAAAAYGQVASPPTPVPSTPQMSLSSPPIDLEYAQTPQISHATRIVAAQPTITAHSRYEGSNSYPVELQQVITEKSSSPLRQGSPMFHGGDKEEYFDERQDSSDDEGDNDDVSVEMLVVDHN
ncbi:MAG: alpha/beta hydrolase fold-domain-containing protein [Benniella sp.]|nr:MAG: alpha/beta hydrolase fold-domain-containing protein [Benniella sp.]